MPGLSRETSFLSSFFLLSFTGDKKECFICDEVQSIIIIIFASSTFPKVDSARTIAAYVHGTNSTTCKMRAGITEYFIDRFKLFSYALFLECAYSLLL